MYITNRMLFRKACQLVFEEKQKCFDKIYANTYDALPTDTDTLSHGQVQPVSETSRGQDPCLSTLKPNMS